MKNNIISYSIAATNLEKLTYPNNARCATATASDNSDNLWETMKFVAQNPLLDRHAVQAARDTYFGHAFLLTVLKTKLL